MVVGLYRRYFDMYSLFCIKSHFSILGFIIIIFTFSVSAQEVQAELNQLRFYLSGFQLSASVGWI